MAVSPRRSAILASATAEFAAHGYHGARIERIAAAAGANKQLIFHYFGSKDGLYDAVVAELFLTGRSAGDDGAIPFEALKTRVGELAGFLGATSGATQALVDGVKNLDIPVGARGVVASWLRRELDVLKSAIADGQRKGYCRDDVDGDAIAEVAIASLVGCAALFPRTPEEGPSPRAPGALIGRMVADFCAWR